MQSTHHTVQGHSIPLTTTTACIITVEQAYFYMWWQDATAQQKQDAHTLVKRGQLEFVVGGWVMPDEATTDYASLIETMTIGHEFIYDTFGVVPRYGFQVHTSTNLALSLSRSHSHSHVSSP